MSLAKMSQILRGNQYLGHIRCKCIFFYIPNAHAMIQARMLTVADMTHCCSENIHGTTVLQPVILVAYILNQYY